MQMRRIWRTRKGWTARRKDIGVCLETGLCGHWDWQSISAIVSARSITVSGCTRLRRGLVDADTLPRQWAKLRAADSDVRQPSLQNQDQQASKQAADEIPPGGGGRV